MLVLVMLCLSLKFWLLLNTFKVLSLGFCPVYIYIFLPDDSPSETMKNAFYFI